MTPGTTSPDARARLALGCSALARAGQVLSTATSAEQARAALRQVATQLQNDRILSGLISTGEVSRRCRESAEHPDDPQVMVACRQMATSLARQASSLAAEVQQKGASSGSRPAVRAASVKPEPPAEAVPEVVPSLPPVEAPRLPVAAESVRVAVAAARPEPVLDAEWARRVSVACNEMEQRAVAAMLSAGGRRFALVGNGTLVDVRTNRMWTSALSEEMPHAGAMRHAGQGSAGGYGDWRLPSPEELRVLLAENGLQALRGLGVLPASGAALLWSNQVRSRFLGLWKDGVVFHSGTGELMHRALKSVGVRVLLVRG